MLEGSCLCGQVRWRFDAVPDGATACNCTVCRRYGVLWIYGHEGEDVHVIGDTTCYTRGEGSSLAFHFCPSCGCVTHWRGLRLQANGRRRLAVNMVGSDVYLVSRLYKGGRAWDAVFLNVQSGKVLTKIDESVACVFKSYELEYRP
jgi:hypothetical protein